MSEAPEIYEPAAGERPIRGHVRAVGHDRVSHGLFLPEIHNEDRAARRRRELCAWLQVLTSSARFTHLTAADLYGWDTPKLPDQVPVFVAVGKKDPVRTVPGWSAAA